MFISLLSKWHAHLLTEKSTENIYGIATDIDAICCLTTACCQKAKQCSVTWNFMPWHLWPPDSPDPSPVDCKTVTQTRVCQKPVRDVDELKQHLIKQGQESRRVSSISDEIVLVCVCVCLRVFVCLFVCVYVTVKGKYSQWLTCWSVSLIVNLSRLLKLIYVTYIVRLYMLRFTR